MNFPKRCTRISPNVRETDTFFEPNSTRSLLRCWINGSEDPEFKADPYMRYGGKSPHTRSHGESFLDLLNNRLGDGLFLMDEPEAALSPQRQLSLLAWLNECVRRSAFN